MKTTYVIATSLALAAIALSREIEIASSADPQARDPGARATAPDAGERLFAIFLRSL